MTGQKDMYVSKVIQKAFIEVNEKGAEAAAATGGIMMMKSAMPAYNYFTCDRPFIFMIKDSVTGLVLFSGRVTNPLHS